MRDRHDCSGQPDRATPSGVFRGMAAAGLALALALAVAPSAGAADRPGQVPTSMFGAVRAEVRPAEEQPEPAGWTKWLPIVVFMGVTFPVLVLLLTFINRKRPPIAGPDRKVTVPERPGTAAAEAGAAAALAEPLGELKLPPSVDPAALCTRPDPAPKRRPREDSEGALQDFPAAEPPLSPVPGPSLPPAREGRDRRWCSTCAVAVAPGADNRLPPWCPRCGGSLGPLPEWARPADPAPDGSPLPPSLGGAPRDGPASIPVETINPGGPLQAPMGRGVVYTATVKARCWKQHTCTACGCVYRYKFERTGVAQSRVSHLARDGAEKDLRGALERQVDAYPCPTCGLVQPDMVAQTKVPWHTGVTVALAALLPCAVLAAVYQGLTFHGAGVLCAAAAAAGAVLHSLVALYDPNRSREANRQKVKAQVERHRLKMVERGSMTDLCPPPRNLTWKHAAALLAIVGGAAFFLGPELVRRNADLPVNPGLSPYVVAPGDEVKFDFPDDHGIRSVDARWRAVATAKLLNADEIGAPTDLAAASSTDNWGTDFLVGEGSERAAPALYARVQLPGDDAVAGKTLRLRISLDVTYPSVSDRAGVNPTFRNQGMLVSRDFTVRVAGAEDKQDYEDAWWTGVIVGLLGSLGGGGLLAWLAVALRSGARPTQLLARDL